MSNIVTSNIKTMTSREIAELTGKELAHVHRDIRSMLNELKKDAPNLDHPLEDKDSRGYTTCFHLNRELTETLLTGYSASARLKVIRRWHDLEAQAASPAFAIPKTYTEALRLAADLADGKAKAELEVVEKQKQLEMAQPKVKALDQIATFGNGSYCIRETAKLLGLQEKRLRQKLQEIHWIYHPPVGGNWLGYAPAREKGYVEHKRTEGEKPDGGRWESVQVRITDKGLAKLAVLFQTEMEPA